MAARDGEGSFSGSVKQHLGWIAIALAFALATFIAAATWERVRTRPADRTIRVTGSAKKRIVSDLIEWSGTVEATDPADRTAAYRTLHGHIDKVLKYLREQGVKSGELRTSSADVDTIEEKEYVGKGDSRIERTLFKGYRTRQSVTLRSSDVPRIERISREVTGLLEQGVPIASGAPSYHYTKLGERKIEMLAEAAKDARTRADNMLASAGGAAIRRLRSADMGIINVNPADVTETSAEGNNDTSSLEKDLITIVHVIYELE
jgi:hypothetical protein